MIVPLRCEPAAPSPEVQACAARVMHRIRAGRVRALAVVLVDDRGCVITLFAGHNDGQFYTLAAGIGALQHRYFSEG